MGRHRPRVTVVGLGPAGGAYLTDEVRTLMANPGRTFLRTARHPAAEHLCGYVSFDRLYDGAATFAEVYRAIIEELVSAAVACAPDPIVYAVPGSPMVAERTVELLRSDARVEVTVVPGLSFLDLAWHRLDVDPLSAGVRLLDAEQFARHAPYDGGPFLVAQCWSRALLSEIKLSPSFDDDAAVPDVVLLHHLGLPDEQVVRVGWWDLDRTLEPDHLTSLFIAELPAPAELAHEMIRLEMLMATLRAQCPWDQAQTHGSLMPHLLEESYEVLDALRELDAADAHEGAPATTTALAEHVEEELGDLLFQIVFHARLAQEDGRFTLADVARGVREKLVRRHPHVFGDVNATTTPEVIANWEGIKKQEKGRASVTEGIPTDLPALLLSTKLQRKALSAGMPGPARPELGDDLLADVGALVRQEAAPLTGAPEATLVAGDVETEHLLGAALFALADLARRLGVDPEKALRTHALAFRDAVVTYEEGEAGLPMPAAHTH